MRARGGEDEDDAELKEKVAKVQAEEEERRRAETANQAAQARAGADAKYLKGRRRLRRATVARREVRKARVKTTLEATREVTPEGLRPGGEKSRERLGGAERGSAAFPARWRWRNTAWCCATARRRSKTTRAAALRPKLLGRT